ncbi:class I SAM-dependent methyltransferase [Microbacterium esteraromaticum]|uniref:class I SAM-dependent methyltransferase n=1 Tax=Microbacterium esteraromaticum TaxID=57043 RepID=UPI003C2BDD91
MQTTNQAASAYRNLAAAVYELDKPVGRSFGDVELYSELLKDVSGVIFEPAAGNGRVLIPFASKGHSVQGTEPSADMRRLCEQSADAAAVHAPITAGLFSDITAVEAYDAVIIPAGSLQLVTSAQEVRAILERIHRALVPGGRLIFDLDSLSGLFDTSPSARSWATDDGLITLSELVESVDPAGQVRTSQLRYERWVDGALAEAQLEHFVLRFWGHHEMSTLLELCGFTDMRTHGDYQQDAAVTAETAVTTIVATK